MLADRLERLSVMGLPVHQSQDYVGWLLGRLRHRQSTHVVTLNAEMCMQARQNAELNRLIQNADLVIPDGAGIELYFRGLQRRLVKRCPGIELAAELLERLEPGHKVVFYGGTPEVSQTAAQFWQRQRPALNLVAVQHGYAAGPDLSHFLEQLRRLQPDVIFVGLGVPRQERWIDAHRQLCPQATWVGIGGSFDIWAGVKTRAPRWMCDRHLEWLYRLYQEPWRWRRMLALPQFAWSAVLYQWRKR
ncbi:WecB/TagA/CpsF family glycosyltransferase [Vasconcelosia minhoensis]|nr:WecB/TagA/CpsF family glycosyltransferase [Romeria gracilis]